MHILYFDSNYVILMAHILDLQINLQIIWRKKITSHIIS